MNRIINFALVGISRTTERAKGSLVRASKRDDGATAVEYALIIGVVALVIIVGFSELGQAILTRIRTFVAEIG